MSMLVAVLVLGDDNRICTSVAASAACGHWFAPAWRGLRRMFSLLGEAAGAPAGAIAQVMGAQAERDCGGLQAALDPRATAVSGEIERFILDKGGVP